MVLVKRRSSSVSVSNGSSTTRLSRPATSSIAFGNGYISTNNNIETVSSFGKNSPGKRKDFFPKMPQLVYNILGTILLLASIAALMTSKNSWRDHKSSLFGNLDHMDQVGLTTRYKSRITKEINNGVENISHHGPINTWLEKREIKLNGNVETLKDFIQEESRQEAIKKFGVGPHYVKFTVEFPEDNSRGDFIVELASLDHMPHAVNTFLGQVSQRVWDGTVFWHHDGVDHVMAAAGIHYQTGETKHHYFEALNVGELSFGEYSPEVPHEQYTIAFNGRGPEFYINAIDNTELHGPGGQGHHEMNDEADPCFGKVISGLDIIHSMKHIQEKQTQEAEQRREWHDNELTHIVKAEIIQHKK